MAGGHHWVPGETTRTLSALLSPEATKVFETSKTGNPYGLRHDFGSLRDVDDALRELPHSRYNREALVAVRGSIQDLQKQGKLVGGKLSGAQAREIVVRIKTDGLGNKFLLDFNRAELKSLRLLALGGIIAKALEETAKAEKLADRVKANGHYRSALLALRKGDWRRANAEIQGGYPGGRNLVDDIIDAGYAREAMILQRRWQEREKDFIKIENGQSVPGVPDDF